MSGNNRRAWMNGVAALVIALGAPTLWLATAGTRNEPAGIENELPNADPLPSWNDGPAKRAIIDFVERVTRPGSPDFVPVDDRIAAFDNDGTLWTEKPVYVQAAYTIDQVKKFGGDAHAVLSDLVEVVKTSAAAHGGMTTDEFDRSVASWLATARHPRFGRKYTELVYQPMLEVMAYLRDNDFRTFIVSGGGAEFIRTFSEDVYDVPTENVVGSYVKTKFELRNGVPVVVRLPEIALVNDGAGKPVGIVQGIGRRPIAAFGNSDGDLEMLQYVTSGTGVRFGLIVHHTDAVREYAYDRDSHVGELDKALDEARTRGWTVVSMKDDWKVIFPSQ